MYRHSYGDTLTHICKYAYIYIYIYIYMYVCIHIYHIYVQGTPVQRQILQNQNHHHKK